MATASVTAPGSILNIDTDNTKTKPTICCANCGGNGHIYKNCNHPVTSYGIICFRIAHDPKTNGMHPEYVMVQRKDSLSYVEFIRGKYNIENKSYISKLFANMTVKERDNIKFCDFDSLWKNLWQVDDCKAFQKEYQEAKIKFNTLKKGYIMKNDYHEIYYFDIDYILNNTTTTLTEAEWGFPKGRRNINEHDLSCAIREFKEETGIQLKSLKVIKNQKPFEEIFSGSNRIRYKHVYYLALCNDSNDIPLDSNNKVLIREIRDVKWLKYNEAQEKIRPYNIERKELFKRVNQVIMKNLSSNNKYEFYRGLQ